MNNYVGEIPGLGRVPYVDRKRYLWLLSALFPLIPLVGMGLVLHTGTQWTLWLPLAFVYGVIPLLDALFPHDRSNPPEAVVPQLEADAYYRVLNHLTVPLHFVVLICGAWFVAAQDLNWSALLAHSLMVGATSGIAINTGHELGHKKNALDRLAARLVLAVPVYGHFTMEHNVGHHAEVATPEDSASVGFS